MGFTDTEFKVILFLATVFLIGLIIQFVNQPDEKRESFKYDYSEEDSAYFASGITEKNVEKRVDSKQELLDFSVNKSSSSSEDKDVLLEKSINLNSADIEQLIKLPGIGPKTAEKILLYRNEIGGFRSVEQLLEVKGIGRVKLSGIKKYVFVDMIQ